MIVMQRLDQLDSRTLQLPPPPRSTIATIPDYRLDNTLSPFRIAGLGMGPPRGVRVGSSSSVLREDYHHSPTYVIQNKWT